jgi:hypothetical protein
VVHAWQDLKQNAEIGNVKLRSSDVSDNNSTSNAEARPVLWPNGDGTCGRMDRHAEPLSSYQQERGRDGDGDGDEAGVLTQG